MVLAFFFCLFLKGSSLLVLAFFFFFFFVLIREFPVGPGFFFSFFFFVLIREELPYKNKKKKKARANRELPYKNKKKKIKPIPSGNSLIRTKKKKSQDQQGTPL